MLFSLGWQFYHSTLYIYLNVCKEVTDVKLLLLQSNTWNHLTVCKKMSSDSFKNAINKMFTVHMFNRYIIEDLALNKPRMVDMP